MANVLSFKDLQKVNRDFEKPVIDSTNAGISPFNTLLGRFINVPNTFKGVIIGDFIVAQEDGVYVGNNIRLTERGLIRKYVVIDGGGDEIPLDLTRTNKINVIDGTNDIDPDYKTDIMPILNGFNWGRPIIDGGFI
jgi:hypothetical protein